MKTARRKPLRVTSEPVVVDAGIEAEDREIKRLEKLLGLTDKKKRKISETKLNAEFEKEGIGSDFGSFLMELDELSDRVVGRGTAKKAKKAKEESDDEDERDGEEEDEEGEHEEQDEGEEEDGEEDEEEEDEEEKETQRSAEAARQAAEERAARQRGLYGEPDKAKYVPPAKRLAALNDTNGVVHRTVTGLVNRLSESNKDGVLRDLVEIYECNSHQITSAALFDNLFLTYKDSVQKLPAVCLLQGGLVSALSVTVGSEVIGFMLEKLFDCFRTAIRQCVAEGDLETKLPHNILILLCSLYALRLLHHQLISDLLNFFASKDCDMFLEKDHSATEKENAIKMELRLDFIEIIAHYGGEFLRVDDPVAFQSSLEMINTNATKPSSSSSSGEEEGLGRQQYILETLNNIRTGSAKNKPLQESVRQYRKWLGGVKSTFPRRKADVSMNISLGDLLNIEAAGRWWLVGASWKSNLHDASEDASAAAKAKAKAKTDEEKDLVDTAAAKMKLSGGNKKLIFRALMNSRDVVDAFESLMRLDLKGKGDRDIVRVLCECCSHENPYNPFYAEISKMICEHSRQAKITYQFVVWDAIKSFRYDLNIKHVINLTKLCVELVTSFHLPLIFLKIFSSSELEESDICFLVSFFKCLFMSPAEDTNVLDVVDRIATSKDFGAVRDMISLVLKVHLKDDKTTEQGRQVLKRKKMFLKRLHEMKVLDMNE